MVVFPSRYLCSTVVSVDREQGHLHSSLGWYHHLDVAYGHLSCTLHIDFAKNKIWTRQPLLKIYKNTHFILHTLTWNTFIKNTINNFIKNFFIKVTCFEMLNKFIQNVIFAVIQAFTHNILQYKGDTQTAHLSSN